MIASRWSRAMRARKRDERAGPGVGAVQVLDHEQDRASLSEPPQDAEDRLRAGAPGGARARSSGLDRPPRSRTPRRLPSSGRSRTSSSVARPMTSARSSSGRPASAGRRARTSGAYGGSVASPNEAAAQHSHRLAERGDPADHLIDEAGRCRPRPCRRAGACRRRRPSPTGARPRPSRTRPLSPRTARS